MTAPDYLRPVFGAMGRCVAWAGTDVDADVVHCHTWYTHLGGILISQGYGLPLVITVHSLEPLRPWKREQLRGGYDLSCWVEQTALGMADAVVAVSKGTRADILRVTGRSTRARPRHLQRHRHQPLSTRGGDRRPGALTASIRADRWCCSSAASPARRASSTWRGRYR